MKLKSLELKGFKSFANTTVINFNEDVTGVVGPNGSGKSNIVDAIRWVLGEQKGRELRTDSRSDVIFNGADAKKPAGVAQVSITFSNTKNVLPTEFNEVKISRFQYRNGDSEYQLNGVKCRLRDIHDLLVDTGIGSNSYAIIALGMVEDILKDKDNARRKMFEQVAGISKFKKRKKETLSKLKSTSEDLERVEDLLHEIEGNMKSLEKQAKRTEKYYEYKEQYKNESIQFSVLSISDLKEKHQSLAAKIEKSEDQYRSLEVDSTQKEAALESDKKSQISDEQNLSEKQRVVNEIVNTIRDKEEQKNLLQQQVSFKKETLEANKDILGKSKPELEALSNQLKNKAETREKLSSELAQLNQVQSSLKLGFEKAEKAFQESKVVFDSVASKRQHLEQQGYEKSKELAIFNNRDGVLQNELKNLLIELKTKEDEMNGIQSKLTKVKESIAVKKQKIESLESNQSKILEQRETAQQEKVNLDQKLVDVNRTLDAKTNEHRLLKSMIENLEGFPESIKFLSKKWNKKVPILSDILDVDTEFKGVIEHFLEPYLNYYLVKDIKEASEAIQLLSNAQKGKAQFFLLDEIPKSSPNKLKTERSAKEVVSVDKKYSNLLDYLLEEVYLTDVKASSLKGKDGIYLSVNGDFVKRKKSISGGSVGLFEGKKIGRKKELEKLEKLIKTKEEAKTKLSQDLQRSIKKIEDLEEQQFTSEIENLKQELSLEDRSHVEWQTRIEGLKNQIDQLKSRKQNAEDELKGVQSGLKATNLEISNLQKSLESKDVKQGNPDQLEALSVALSIATKEFNEGNILLIQKNSEIEKLESDIEFTLRRKNEIEERILLSQKELDAGSTDSNEIITEIKSLEEELKGRYEKRDTFKEDLSAFEHEFFKRRNSIAEKEEEIRELNRRLQKTQILINESKDKFNDVKFKMSSVGERLKIEFEVELETVINQEIPEDIKLSELRESVERLRKRLNNFGEINPMAVEAFNTMKERYDLISGQRNDILDAKASLLDTIYEIEGTATDLFKESFTKVRENFITVFRSLFNEGDSCDLILENEDDPLDSGIEVIAKPKGKRPLSLSQLSGGEMTLTATALLFAFYLQKPAPFCVFDEVDAPLDDVNVMKFNKIIKKFSKDSQFVIVTHNKATMAEVDVLYGVHMQDMGISSVTPVDFRKFDHQPVMKEVK